MTPYLTPYAELGASHGLRPEISEVIHMFKPKTLKEAISLARMKDKQLQRQKEFFRPPPSPTCTSSVPSTSIIMSPVKRLSWDETQRRHAQGLCFNCDEKFSSGHRCKGPQLLLLEGNFDAEAKEDNSKINPNLPSDPDISLHALTG